MVGRIWDKGDCWPMKMGVRAEDLEIEDFFYFFFPYSKFAIFGQPGMEGDSRRGVRLYLQVSCGGGRGGRRGLVKWVIMDKFACYLRSLFSSDVFLFIYIFWWGGVCKSANFGDVLFR